MLTNAFSQNLGPQLTTRTKKKITIPTHKKKKILNVGPQIPHLHKNIKKQGAVAEPSTWHFLILEQLLN